MTYFTMPLSATIPTARFRSELDRLFEDTFTGKAPAGWAPAVDVRESATALTFDVELPGVSAQTLEVLAEDGVLTIKGEKPARSSQEGERTLVSQRTSGDFARSFRLPKNADAGKIDAQFSDGLLSVRVEKVAPPQPRKVTVQVNAQPSATAPTQPVAG